MVRYVPARRLFLWFRFRKRKRGAVQSSEPCLDTLLINIQRKTQILVEIALLAHPVVGLEERV